MHPYLLGIKNIFQLHINMERASWSKAYMLNQFEFFGLVTVNRRKLSKDYMKQHPLSSLKELETIVKECFELPQREYQYFAVELMAFHKNYGKFTPLN